MRDEDLISMFLEGDINSFNYLVIRWRNKIFSLLYRFTGSKEDAEDLTQETFVKVFKNLKALKDKNKFSSWITSVALNTARTHLNHRKSCHEELNKFDFHKDSNQSDVKEVFENAFKHLPEDQREVILLKEYQGFSFKEISEILNIPEGTAKSRMFYGLKNLKNYLSPIFERR
ncbi:MAG: RNA polymerase sigma factor [Acidobacteriota bacterium]